MEKRRNIRLCYNPSMSTKTSPRIDDAVRTAERIVRAHLPDPAYRLFLFGSRASGKARERSDIDLGIEGPSPVPYEILSAIESDLEESDTLYTVDVVDFTRVPEKFRAVAKERILLPMPA